MGLKVWEAQAGGHVIRVENEWSLNLKADPLIGETPYRCAERLLIDNVLADSFSTSDFALNRDLHGVLISEGVSFPVLCRLGQGFLGLSVKCHIEVGGRRVRARVVRPASP